MLMPATADYVQANFNYQVNGGAWPNNVNELQVASNGSNLYDHSLITIQSVLPIPNTATQPATDTLGEGGVPRTQRPTGTARGTGHSGRTPGVAVR